MLAKKKWYNKNVDQYFTFLLYQQTLQENMIEFKDKLIKLVKTKLRKLS